ncbi:putative PHD transcription factor [Aspergillus lucknowensis]|uniref:PHD-type domain-containing protein n=1 Tax=Aspergillus lucknowensis TaxID=176173 RepID=A0ABR4LRB9_9EURO
MAEETSQANGSTDNRAKICDPYETDPERIPADDPFRQRSVYYGRYRPREDDFKPRDDEWCRRDLETIRYWEDTVKTLWAPENSLHVPGARQAYAAGSVIIRVDQEDVTDATTERFSFLNANELSASRKAEDALRDLDVAVPKLYFCGPVSGKNVTVEARIPGVSLDVAWKSLTPEQIELLRQQCRHILQRLGNIDSRPDHPSYVCNGLNPKHPSATAELERNILFKEGDKQDDNSFVHNNMLLSNIVVDNDRVVGLTGWRESGYFGLERARKVHRQIRVPQIASEKELGASLEDLQAWDDLYEGLPAATVENGPTDVRSAPTPPVKIEPSNVSLDGVPANAEIDIKPWLPQLDGTDVLEDHPTPKKVASLKGMGDSRASSTDRSSPANSTKASAKRGRPATTKKGVGRKPAAKKRKLDDQDNESVSSRRSQTPSSSRTSKARGMKKQNSASLANSPTPEIKKKGAQKAAVEQQLEEEEEEDSEDNDEVFCICRKPDNHTWMIGCDGGCEDWFHGKCVNIDPRDADLIEKYICPNCKANGKGWTTWKPMCRLKGCRKPARFNQRNPSKYCSDEHGLEFMRQKTQHLNLPSQSVTQKPKTFRRGALNGSLNLKDDDSEFGGSHIGDYGDDGMADLGSRGGVLTAGDLAAVIMGVTSADEFRKLGAHIVEPLPEMKDEDAEGKPSKKLGLDVGVDGLNYSPDEAEKIEKLRKRRDDLFHRRDMLDARSTFLTLVRQRSKSIVEVLKKKDPKGGWKDICGFDTRLAWADDEFDEWRLSEAGKNALEEGTPEALASSFPSTVDGDGDMAMDGDYAEDELTSLTRGVCTKKRCERHKQWLKVQQQDAVFEERTLTEDLAECEKEAQAVVERAVLRMWAENGNLQNGC